MTMPEEELPGHKKPKIIVYESRMFFLFIIEVLSTGRGKHLRQPADASIVVVFDCADEPSPVYFFVFLINFFSFAIIIISSATYYLKLFYYKSSEEDKKLHETMPVCKKSNKISTISRIISQFTALAHKLTYDVELLVEDKETFHRL